MDRPPLFLALDQGGSASRALVFDARGHERAAARIELGLAIGVEAITGEILSLALLRAALYVRVRCSLRRRIRLAETVLVAGAVRARLKALEQPHAGHAARRGLALLRVPARLSLALLLPVVTRLGCRRYAADQERDAPPLSVHAVLGINRIVPTTERTYPRTATRLPSRSGGFRRAWLRSGDRARLLDRHPLSGGLRASCRRAGGASSGSPRTRFPSGGSRSSRCGYRRHRWE